LIRIGLIGYGTIARAVCETFRAAAREEQIVVVLVRPGRVAEFLGYGISAVDRIEDMLARELDIVAEIAGHEAVREHADAILDAGCDFLITSVGALADDAFLQRIRDKAHDAARKVLLPSGAIGGIDALAAMRRAGLRSVTYRSRKPPTAWKGSDAETLLDLGALRTPATFYRGSARDAARRYPKNANVAATVALAGMGMDATQVELVADPTVSCNIHEIDAAGVSGRISLRMEGHAFPDNPRSSMLTAFSVANALMNIDAALPI
jgi:aspartate dehydrogenase